MSAAPFPPDAAPIIEPLLPPRRRSHISAQGNALGKQSLSIPRSERAEPGASAYFMLGALYVADPVGLARELSALRTSLLANPYFKNVPSMQPEDGKTALFFHAKDDLPEIRFQVFQLLMQQDVGFYAVIRDKHRLVEEVRARNRADAGYWYRENQLYDELASQLFKSRFHEADEFRICFAERGSSDRTAALQTAIEHARETYELSFGIRTTARVTVTAALSRIQAGLQAADYFLWALKRLYEREEDRYWEFVRPKAKLIYDMDDTRQNRYGVYYTPAQPLTKTARAKK